MISAVALLAYGLAAVLVVSPALARAGWTTRAPRAAILAWHLLCLVAVGTAVLAALLLSLSLPHVGTTFASMVEVWTTTLQHLVAASHGHTTSTVVVALLLLLLLTRVAYVGARLLVSSHTQHARLRGLLAPVAKAAPGYDGALVIDHAERYAFCFPGRRGRIVVTSALLEGLSGPQVQAVLAHEHAHLRQRHHLALLTPTVLNAAFGATVPLFATAEREVARLVELSADDAARRHVGSQALAGALRQMSPMPLMSSVLGASAVALEERLRRLDGGSGRLAPSQGLLVWLGMTALTITPFVFALAPLVASGWLDLWFVGETVELGEVGDASVEERRTDRRDRQRIS